MNDQIYIILLLNLHLILNIHLLKKKLISIVFCYLFPTNLYQVFSSMNQ